MRRLFPLLVLLLGLCLPVYGQQQFPTGGTGPIPNTGSPQASGLAAGFNVVNYGAHRNAQSSINGSFTNGSPIVTCSDCHFQNGKTRVGMSVWGQINNVANVLALLAQSTITSIDSDTQIHVSNNGQVATTTGLLLWGDIDDTAVAAAATAAKAASLYITNQGGYLGVAAAAPVLYFPAGAYLLCSAATPSINITSGINGFEVRGDGLSNTVIYFGGSGCTSVNNSARGAVLDVASGAQNISIHGFTVNGILGSINQAAGIGVSGNAHIWDVNVDDWGGGAVGAGVYLGGQALLVENVHVVNGGADGILCSGCSGEIYLSGASNGATSSANGNLRIVNVGAANSSEGLVIFGGLEDECGTNTTGCTQVINSHDVTFMRPALFGTVSGFALNVDGDSFVKIVGGLLGSFGNDTNVGGLKIGAGGTVEASGTRFISTGTAKAITVGTGALFRDNGGNSAESQFVIASGTSTGTTAVLTLTTLGANANTNCTIGDTIEVQGAAIAGYNGFFPFGITATGATTLTYTTVGSNLGALGAGGVAYCKNLQSYTGPLPTAMLNNPVPNTCYVTITPIVNATTYLLCNFKTQSATNITRITASSQVSTTCATAPIITISDGTATQTLTLTSAKTQWDSSVDASTGVGTTIFKPNGTITVKYDVAAASACATPPTQLSVSYNISPILSNP